MKIKIMIVMAGVLGFSGVWASSDKSEKKVAKEKEKAAVIAKDIIGQIRSLGEWSEEEIRGEIESLEQLSYIHLPVWVEKEVDTCKMISEHFPITTNSDGTIIAQIGVSDQNPNSEGLPTKVMICDLVNKKTSSFDTKGIIRDFAINNTGSTVVVLEGKQLNFYDNGILNTKKSKSSDWSLFAATKDLSLFFGYIRYSHTVFVDNSDGNVTSFEASPIDMTTQQGDTLVIATQKTIGGTDIIELEKFINIYKKKVVRGLINYREIDKFEVKETLKSLSANNDASIIVSNDLIYYRTKDETYKKALPLKSDEWDMGRGTYLNNYISTINSDGSIIFTVKDKKLYKWTNIILEYQNQLTRAHRKLIKAFYASSGKKDEVIRLDNANENPKLPENPTEDDKNKAEQQKASAKHFETLKSMPWPIIQAVIKVYPIKFSKEQTTELKALKDDFDKKKATEKKSGKEGESKKTAESDKK